MTMVGASIQQYPQRCPSRASCNPRSQAKAKPEYICWGSGPQLQRGSDQAPMLGSTACCRETTDYRSTKEVMLTASQGKMAGVEQKGPHRNQLASTGKETANQTLPWPDK